MLHFVVISNIQKPIHLFRISIIYFFLKKNNIIFVKKKNVFTNHEFAKQLSNPNEIVPMQNELIIHS